MVQRAKTVIFRFMFFLCSLHSTLDTRLREIRIVVFMFLESRAMVLFHAGLDQLSSRTIEMFHVVQHDKQRGSRCLSIVILRPFDLLRINSAEECLFCRALTRNPNVNQ